MAAYQSSMNTAVATIHRTSLVQTTIAPQLWIVGVVKMKVAPPLLCAKMSGEDLTCAEVTGVDNVLIVKRKGERSTWAVYVEVTKKTRKKVDTLKNNVFWLPNPFTAYNKHLNAVLRWQLFPNSC